MNARAKRPRLKKIDVRVPVVSSSDIDAQWSALDAVDRTLLRNIDGQSTVNALASTLGVSEAQILSALEKLERRGLVVLAARRPTTKSSPPRRLQSGMRPASRTLPSIEPSTNDVRTREVEVAYEERPEADGRATLLGLGPRGR
jgi:DNA-binding transcriptional MocR family regulator